MNEFFDTWGKLWLWYPDSFAFKPDFYWPVFWLGLLSFFVLLLGKNHIWLRVLALPVFLWALPALVVAVLVLVYAVLALALLFLIIAIGLWGWNCSTPEYTAKKTGKDTWEIHKHNNEPDDD